MKTSKSRKSRCRLYKKVFYIITEGTETEPSYFDIVTEYIENEGIALSCHPAKRSSISSILQMAKDVASKKNQARDEVWVVVDQDSESHLAHQFAKLMQWRDAASSHHIAISAPRFEFWLLCHFEESPSKSDALHDDHVAQHLPGYGRKKSLSRYKSKFSAQKIQHAINVASHFPLNSYDSLTPGSDVGKLVQALLPDQGHRANSCTKVLRTPL